MRFCDALVLLLRLLPNFWPLTVLILIDCLMAGTVLDGVVAAVERLRAGTNLFGLGPPPELTFVLLT